VCASARLQHHNISTIYKKTAARAARNPIPPTAFIVAPAPALAVAVEGPDDVALIEVVDLVEVASVDD